MTRTSWSGRTITRITAYLVRRDGHLCWLCHHPTPEGTRSIDHIHPVSTHPDLEHTPTNWKLAHLTKAGTEQGCKHPGCDCPGNKQRKAKPWTAPPSRSW